MDDTTFGVPVTFDSGDPAKPFGSVDGMVDQVVDKLRGQIAELTELGVQVVKIQIMATDQPVRLFIKFPEGEPQWKVRKLLETKLYDVGQKIGNNELAFYATKRPEKTKGWAT